MYFLQVIIKPARKLSIPLEEPAQRVIEKAISSNRLESGGSGATPTTFRTRNGWRGLKSERCEACSEQGDERSTGNEIQMRLRRGTGRKRDPEEGKMQCCCLRYLVIYLSVHIVV